MDISLKAATKAGNHYFRKLLFLFLVLVLVTISLAGCGKTTVTLSSLTISPSVVGQGQTVSISVNVLNLGNKVVTGYKLTFSVNNINTETKTVNLNPNETSTFTFEYVPDSTGNYHVSVNEQTGTFAAVKSASFKVEQLTTNPASPIAGQETIITAVLTNEGELAGTYTATFKVNGDTIKTDAIKIEAGASLSALASFTPESSGMYVIELGGVTSNIKVLKPAEFKSTSISVNPRSVYSGDSTVVSAEISNMGENEGTLPVALLVNGAEVMSESITLGAGSSTTVDFTYSPSAVGTLTLKILESSTTLNVIGLSEYTNSGYYYSISYPSDFTVNEIDSTTTGISNDEGGISVLVDEVSTGETPQGYFEAVAAGKRQQLPDWSYSSRTNVMENGVIIGYKYDYTNTVQGAKWVGKGMMLKKGGLGFYVVFTTKEADWNRYKGLAARIIDSFVLPSIKAGDYANVTNGLAFTMPDEWTAIDADEMSVKIIHSLTSIYGIISRDPAAEDVTAQEYINDLVSMFVESGWVLESSGSFTFNDLSTGYEALLSGDTGTEILALRLIAVSARNIIYYMLWLGTDSEINAQATAITQMSKSLVISTPGIAGLNRSETLVLLEGEIPTLDPAKVEEAPDGIAGAIFSGLVRIDSDLNIVPDLAERWTISDDGTVYTFYIRQNAKFHSGKQVTAADVKYSWERACDPATDTPKDAIFLNDIVGATDMINGTATSISGIRVINDSTLEVTINTGIQYFLHKIAQPVAYIVNEANVAEGPTWYEQPDGTGPFKLKSWEKNSLLILERFEDFYEGPVQLKNIAFKIFAGQPMILYENDEIDITGVYISDQDRVLNPSDPLNADLLTGTTADIEYVGFNVNKPPFDDPKVREAFAMALDVDKLLEVALKGRAERADGYLPEGVPGFNPNLPSLAYDVDMAKQLIAESTYGGVDNLPPIKFYVLYGTSDLQEAIIGMWQTLGAQVTIETITEYQTYLDRQRNHEFQVWAGGWRADYLDPQNFLEVLFISNGPENSSSYSNQQVDELLTQAGIEPDEETRLQKYQEAEELILEDLPVFPLFRNSYNYVLVKPWVKGYQILPFGAGLWRDIYLVAH